MDDKKLITSLGGPAAVADLIGLPRRGGAQRVNNWMTRGIPAAVKLAHPDLFLQGMKIPKRRRKPDKPQA